jgi:HAD superfamily hydrolase (TIGR01509 family)
LIRAVLFDLDDVLRHFEPCDAIEAEYGIPRGGLNDAAFDASVLDDAVTGRTSYHEWIDAIGDLLAARHGESARGAAAAFSELPDHVDDAVLAIARAVRRTCTTAILTNGTTRVEAECERLALTDEFDHLFNSTRIGYAKPDRRIFEHVVGVLGVAPGECAFTDDNAHKLTGARDLGMHGIHFTGAEDLRRALRDLGVAC